jgi:NAD(P)-dependent dehydrogenase (short-subunit alcohol dehydrogenase family)
MADLKKKIALVTGASRGIGQAAARSPTTGRVSWCITAGVAKRPNLWFHRFAAQAATPKPLPPTSRKPTALIYWPKRRGGDSIEPFSEFAK